MGEQIFTKEQLDRIKAAAGNIRIDVHGLGVYDAIRLIKNVIALNFRRHNFTIEIVHGYNGGSAIMQALRGSKKNRLPVSTRITGIETCPWNLGITYLTVA